MKATGIVRSIDELGRIVVPKEFRKSIGISAGDPVEISCENNRIVIAKYFHVCHFCGATEGISEFKGKNICDGCLSELKSL